MSEPARHRPFLIWPDPRLKTVADPVAGVTDEIRAIWDEMIAAMRAMPGVGLAAPQLGIGLRLAVVDASDGRDSPVRLANPRLLWTSDETAEEREGSPNLPGQWAKVARPAAVRVAFTDEAGRARAAEWRGLWARSVQHQIDHLDGRLFIDRLGAVTRARLIERHRKARQKAARGRG